MKTRPISITILSVIYIVAGGAGLAYHAPEWKTPAAEHWAIVWISAIRVLAIVVGIGMLRAQNWARWVAIAWMAFHVAISFWDGWPQVVVHAAFLIVISYLLLRRPASDYFAGNERP